MRITPAYAGNTFGVYHRGYFRRDHPRLRGEHIRMRSASVMEMGSPPPTRGTQWVLAGEAAYFRITPAYAGNTLKRPSKIRLF